jgi:hypothetical protein
MQTQKGAQRPTNSLLVPPISLEFEILQTQRDHCQVHVRASSGSHCFVHREVLAFYDHFGEIPVMVSSSMCSWLLWLVQVEAERRQADPRQRRQLQFQFPAWPSSESLQVLPEDVEF